MCKDPVTKSPCNAEDMAGQCHDRGGPHWRVHETSEYHNDRMAGTSHHPPAGMHLLRAEVLAYVYSHILLDAIYDIQDRLAAGATREALLADYSRKLEELQVPMPEEPTHCVFCRTQPQCHTSYRPHFNPQLKLQDIFVGSNEVFTHNENGPTKYGYQDEKIYFTVCAVLSFARQVIRLQYDGHDALVHRVK